MFGDAFLMSLLLLYGHYGPGMPNMIVDRLILTMTPRYESPRRRSKLYEMGGGPKLRCDCMVSIHLVAQSIQTNSILPTGQLALALP